jgi:hypothetical protein
LIDVLVDELVGTGKHKLQWDGSPHSSGMYFLKLSSNNYSKIKKIVLTK